MRQRGYRSNLLLPFFGSLRLKS